MSYTRVSSQEGTANPILDQLIDDNYDNELADKSIIGDSIVSNQDAPTIPPLLLVNQLAKLFDIPVSPKMFFTIRGSENFHIYLWIAKDFSWSQGLLWESMIFGACTIGWCAVLMRNAFKYSNYEEVYFLFPVTLWLFANYWWMSGILHLISTYIFVYYI